MSTSSNKVHLKVKTTSTSSNKFHAKAREEEDIMPEWLKYFMRKTFFDKCIFHNRQKNNLNRYCITCDESICKFCITDDHFEHEVLTIYKHVCQNVVPLNEIERYLNCAKIQTYKCRRMLVVSLTTLPHNGPSFLIEGNVACTVCERKLTGDFRFCSIACKFEEVRERRSERRFDEGGSSLQDDGDDEKVQQVVKEQKMRKHSRKGVPHRAPLF